MLDQDPYLDLLKKCLTGYLYEESAWEPLLGMVVNNQNLMVPPELCLLKRTRFHQTAREVGRDWPIIGHTMIGLRRLDNLQFCIDQVLRNGIPGDLMETGVWRGGAGIFMRAMLKHRGVTDRIVWLADSFEGMPPPGPVDLALGHTPETVQQEFLRASIEQVQDNFQRYGLLDDRVRFLKGWFKDTLPSAPVQRLAVLRLDGDLYESTTDALTALYHRLSPGGYLIIDDYMDWAGCRKAVDEFRSSRGITAEIIKIDLNGVFWQIPPAGR